MANRPASPQEIEFIRSISNLPPDRYTVEARGDDVGVLILHPANGYRAALYYSISCCAIPVGEVVDEDEGICVYLSPGSIQQIKGVPSQQSPYGMPMGNPYGMPNNPYGTPMGNPYGMPNNPYGTPMGNPYGMPNNPYGMPMGNPYGMPNNPYGMPMGNPYTAQSPATATGSISDQIKALQASLDAKLGISSCVSEERKLQLKEKRLLSESISRLVSCGYTTCALVHRDNTAYFYGYLDKDDKKRLSEIGGHPYRRAGGKAFQDYFVFNHGNAAYFFGERIKYLFGGQKNCISIGSNSPHFLKGASEYSGGYEHFAWIDNGVVRCVGKSDHGQLQASGWVNCTKIACGMYHTVALKNDGTVLATGENSNRQCNVSSWRNIVAISCGDHHTVGLRDDGTVVATGSDGYGQCQVENWQDIIAISASSYNTVGLKEDGTVVICGNRDYGQADVGSWRNIVAIAAGGKLTVAITADGKIRRCGSPSTLRDMDDFSLFTRAERRDEEAQNHILEQERKKKEESDRYWAEVRREREERQRQQLDTDRRKSGLCRFCGGPFKGILNKTCSKCGRPKDY